MINQTNTQKNKQEIDEIEDSNPPSKFLVQFSSNTDNGTNEDWQIIGADFLNECAKTSNIKSIYPAEKIFPKWFLGIVERGSLFGARFAPIIGGF